MRRNNYGFTLIEAMVVVAIIGILAAVAVPAFTKMTERNRLKGAAESLFNDLQLARTEAIKRNLNVELQFSAAGPVTTWCWGLRERVPNNPTYVDLSAACDCTQIDPLATNACKIDGVLKVTRSADYPKVSMENNFAGPRVMFEPRQGVSDVTGGAGASDTAFLRLGTDDLRVIVRTLGRVQICTASGMPGYQPCP